MLGLDWIAGSGLGDERSHPELNEGGLCQLGDGWH